MKFRKKPVVIEAFQMTEARRNDNSDWPEWLHRAWQLSEPEPGALCINEGDLKRQRLFIVTLEGRLHVEWNDWIIQGVKGELYPCKPDIFDATYEPVENET